MRGQNRKETDRKRQTGVNLTRERKENTVEAEESEQQDGKEQGCRGGRKWKKTVKWRVVDGEKPKEAKSVLLL